MTTSRLLGTVVRSVLPAIFFLASALVRIINYTDMNTSLVAALQMTGSILWVVSSTIAVWRPYAAAGITTVAGLVFFAGFTIVVSSNHDTDATAAAWLQLAGSVGWVAHAVLILKTEPELWFSRDALIVIAAFGFFLGAAVLVITTDNTAFVIGGWLQLAGAVMWMTRGDPMLYNVRDWWLLEHVLFGAMLATLWMAAFANNLTAIDTSVLLTLCVATIWYFVGNQLNVGIRYKWAPSVWISVATHCLIVYAKVTRTDILNGHRFLPFAVFASAWAVVATIGETTRPQHRQPPDALERKLTEL
jgi:hypothetical protein